MKHLLTLILILVALNGAGQTLPHIDTLPIWRVTTHNTIFGRAIPANFHIWVMDSMVRYKTKEALPGYYTVNKALNHKPYPLVERDMPHYSYSINDSQSFRRRVKYDTIPCIMLCSDTSRRFLEYYKRYGSHKDSVTGYWTDSAKLVREYGSHSDSYCFWIEGHEVLKHNPRRTWQVDWEPAIPEWEHVAWLDKKKQPISKKRIVWMSKDIK
ncbi:MAG: hypothetical protein HQK96_03850 [Nitrospirae bacterium]|nr:hypothetical protein [Nitrospirota bacterium]